MNRISEDEVNDLTNFINQILNNPVNLDNQKVNRLIFKDEICEETVSPLLGWIESIEPEEEAKLYFSSNGGVCGISGVVWEAINSVDNLELCLIESIESAAVDIVLNFEGKISLGPYFLGGMIHKLDNQLSSKELNSSIPSVSKIMAGQYKIFDDISIDLYKGFFTKKQLDDYRKGLDVYFDRKHMESIVKKLNKRNGY